MTGAAFVLPRELRFGNLNPSPKNLQHHFSQHVAE
jgi:hypothetical protein